MIKKSKIIQENIKLKRMIFIWENIGISINSSNQEKEVHAKEFLDKYKEYTMYDVCRTIKLPKATLYNYLYKKVEKPWFKEKEEMVTKEIITIFESSRKLYGQGKINTVLRKKGINVTSKKIGEIMKKNNLIRATVIKRPERQAKRSGCYYRKVNLLKRQFTQTSPNKVWASDFLEININNVKFYLCVIMDLYSRYVIAWRLSHKLSENLAINTFKDAFEFRNEPTGLVFHTDQGGEFTSNVFMDTLRMLGVTQSFSNPGSPNDNAVMEGFYSLLRREEININLYKYENSRVIEEYLDNYFSYYNNVRIHSSLGGITPKEKEDEWLINNKPS